MEPAHKAEARQLGFGSHLSLHRQRAIGTNLRAAAISMLQAGSPNGTVDLVRCDQGPPLEDHDSLQQGASPDRAPSLSAFGRSLIAATPAAPPVPRTAFKGPLKGTGPCMGNDQQHTGLNPQGMHISGLEAPGMVSHRGEHPRIGNPGMASSEGNPNLAVVLLAEPQVPGTGGLPFLEVSQSPASSARSCWAPIKTSIENSSESRSQNGIGSILADADREFLEQSLLTGEKESGIRRLGFDDLDCLEGHEAYAELPGCNASDMGDAHPEDWWIAYATSDDDEDPIFPGAANLHSVAARQLSGGHVQGGSQSSAAPQGQVPGGSGSSSSQELASIDSLNNMLRSMCRIQADAGDAEELVKQAWRGGLAPNATTYHHLAGIWLQQEQLQET
ncbi:hypothetical protein WJX84_003414 [Apatococcus fuscideae]